MRQPSQMLFLFLITIPFVTLITMGTASADMDTEDEFDLWMGTDEEISEAPGYEDPKDKDRDWAVSFGIAGGVAPDYEGSDDYGFGYGPDLALTWRDTIFYKGKTLGVNLIRKKDFKAGTVLSWTSGRDEDDNSKLEGLGDVDSSVELGGFMSYRIKPMRFRLNVLQDIGSGHEGSLVELSGGTTLPFKNPLVFLSVGTTWASNDYMDSFFGIDSGQAAASGLRKYNADAGIKEINHNVATSSQMT